MRALVQRVTQASVTVVETGDGGERSETVVGRIGSGLLVLVGVTHDDTPEIAARMAAKVIKLRVFDDDEGRMNRSVVDAATAAGADGPEILVVSQFTLYGDAAKGNRPSYIEAARPEQAEPLVQAVVDELSALGATVATGRFRTEMAVSLINDGPVTIWLEL